jgi:hypothetical protein
MRLSRIRNLALGQFDRWIVLLCLAFTGLVYLVFIMESDRLMTPGQASRVLAGFEMLRQKTFFLADWVFSREVYTLREPLFIAFFGLFTDSMVLAQRLGALTELALETAAIVYMLRRLDLAGRPGLLAIALFFGARSYQTGMLCGMGFSQDASFYTVTFLTVGYLAAINGSASGKLESVIRYALPAAALLFGLSSAIMFVALYLPLLAVYAWKRAGASGRERDGGEPGSGRSCGFKDIILWNAMFVAGYLVLNFAVAWRGFGPVLGFSGPSAGFSTALFENLGVILSRFVDATPLFYIRGAVLIRSWAMVAGWSFLFFLGYAVWMTPGTLKRAAGPAGDALRCMAFCLLTVIVLTAVCLEPSRIEFGYFLILLPFAAVLLAFIYRELVNVNEGLARFLLVCIIVTATANGANNMATLELTGALSPSAPVIRNRAAIGEILASQGITRAYALYRDSYSLDVLTDGSIKVCAVDGLMRPYLNDTSLSNYSSELSGERTAFILSINRFYRDSDMLELEDRSVLDSAELRYEISDPESPVVVFIFRDNPFTFDGAAFRAFAAPLTQGGGSSETSGASGETGTSESSGSSEDSSESGEPDESGDPGEPGEPEVSGSSEAPGTSDGSGGEPIEETQPGDGDGGLGGSAGSEALSGPGD